MLGINPLFTKSFANISPIQQVFFFAVQNLLSLIRFHLFIFAFVSFTLGDGSKKKKKDTAAIYVQEHSAYGFRLVLQYLCYIQVFNPFLAYFCTWCQRMFQFHSSACSCPIFSSTPETEKKDCLFSILYSHFLCCILIDHNCVGLFLGYFCSIDLCITFLPAPHHFDYCRFAVQPEVRERVILTTLFSLKLVVGIWDCCVFFFLVFPYTF